MAGRAGVKMTLMASVDKTAATAKSERKKENRQSAIPAPISPQAKLKVAHARFIRASEGTREYADAWEAVLDALVEQQS
jgi:hypothetical protein